MKKLHWLGVLMMVAIIAITGFQFWWLKQTYEREQKTLELKTQIAFVSTVHHLQAFKLKLDKIFPDSLTKGQRIIVRDNSEEPFGPSTIQRDNVVITVNALQKEMNDSLERFEVGRSKPVFPEKKIGVFFKNDSTKKLPGLDYRKRQKDFAYVFLSGIDSLQDSLKLKEISAAYSQTLKEQRTEVPFTVLRLDSIKTFPVKPVPNEVTLGFKHPVTYKMQLGNTFPYLLKQITSPIIFSLFLVGVTILSFLLLYRSLLRQRRLAVMKNEFISNITHELKTPIATVGVAIEALRNFGASQNPKKTKEYLEISAAELQRLGLLVDKVLKLSMFENKTVELKKEMFDMRQLVNEIMQIMKLQFEKCQAKVNVKIVGDNFMIEADRLHITSVLYNLLDNALKYSNENPVIELQLSSLPGNILEIKLRDNGRGIAKEYQSRVFEKFFRVPDFNRHNIKGYGLGLSYVKEILASHMGYIVVESEPGKGSTFTIKLPMKEMPVIDFGNGKKIIKKLI